MNITDLIARVRRAAFLPTASTDFTDAWICREINDQMTQLYERAVVRAMQGYWHQIQYYALTAGTTQYRIPYRACTGGIESVQISDAASVEWFELPWLEEPDAVRYESIAEDKPQRHVIRGEFIRVLPAASSSNLYYMRVHYAVRPSRITLPQTTPLTQGLITAVDTTARTITVSAVPDSIDEDGTKTAMGTTGLRVDVVRPVGWNSVILQNLTATRASNVFTLGNPVTGLAEANSMADVQVGDFLFPAEQTNWPALPQDFHRTLADAAAAKIMTQRSMHQKATELMASHVVPELQRFAEMLQPRVAESAYVFVAPDFR